MFLRQRALEARPRHVAVHVLAVRFLRDADLQRAEARLRADLRSEDLIDRWARGAASGIGSARHQPTERAEMAVALAVEARGDVVDAAEHVHVIAHAAERREARRQLEVFARLTRNPVALGNAVAVPPHEESFVDASDLSRFGRVGRAVHVEHGGKRRKTNLDRRAGHADASEELASAEHFASNGPPEGGPYRLGLFHCLRNSGDSTSATRRLFILNPEALNRSYNWSIVLSSASASSLP